MDENLFQSGIVYTFGDGAQMSEKNSKILQSANTEVNAQENNELSSHSNLASQPEATSAPILNAHA